MASGRLQVVHEVARHRIIEVDTIDPEDVMLMFGVNHVVWIGPSLDTGLYKELRVLPDDRGVNSTMDEEQTALEVARTQGEVRLLVALGVVLWAIHIALPVHDLVASPVGDGTTSRAYLEDIGVGQHEIRRHEATIAPASDPDAVGIDVGQALEEVYALHLVGHLILPEVAVDDLLKGCPAVG